MALSRSAELAAPVVKIWGRAVTGGGLPHWCTGKWAVSAAFALSASVLFPIVLVLLGGTTLGAIAIGLFCLLCIVALFHPRWGFYALVFLALLADYTEWSFSAWTQKLGFYLYGNWWKLLSEEGIREFGWLVFNSIDVLMLAVAAGVALRAVEGIGCLILTWESYLALAFLAVVGSMLTYGLATGGDLKPALWQVRPYFHLGGLALLAPQVLRSKKHVRDFTWIILAVILIKAIQINWIFITVAGARFGEWREILGHEDSVFFVGGLTLVLALTLYNVESLQRPILWVAAILLLAALVVNLRRAGYVALGFSLLLVPAVLYGRRAAAIKAGLVLLGIAVVYCILFWNADSVLGTPVQKMKSVVLAEPGSSDYSSNMYRVAESINLRRTIAEHPMGLGFGHPFELHVPLPDISAILPNWRYHPHDMILGLWLSLGTICFVVFLVFIGGTLMLASHNLRHDKDNHIKSISFFALASVTSGFLVAAVDQFIWGERGAIFLGAVVGISSAITALRSPSSAVERYSRTGPPSGSTGSQPAVQHPLSSTLAIRRGNPHEAIAYADS